MRSIKSIKEEFVTICNNMKMDSSTRNDNIKTSAAAAETSETKDALGLGTKKVWEDIVVGLDHHAELIRDKLAEDQKQLDVVSIVGMGGLGKTTLATKVFNDPFVVYHFHVRGWVTVSQTYKKQNLLIQILESIGNKMDNVRDHDYSQLRQMLRQKLMGKRYLIVIDDIWCTEAWDALKLSFPNDETGSRILLTSRLKEVAVNAKSHGFVHQLQYLTAEESWELLRTKVFGHNSACPEWLIKPGMQIARNCHGLPLTLVVVAGVLSKEAASKDSWERIGRSVSSYVVSNQIGYIETLALSVDHLTVHLRECFLYLGGFPEDHKFRVRSLILLWMAEGFIQEDGSIRSLEEIAEDHVLELVDRNLVVVASRKYNGGIKAFYVHDILRELCLKIAAKENFRVYRDTRQHVSELSHFGMLLKVLDLRYMKVDYFPEEISLLVHLRYLAISYNEYRNFPSSICKLWSLQTLIFRFHLFQHILNLPETISNLVNLRHLKCEGYSVIWFPAIQKTMNLQTISRVILADGAESCMKCFPGIKKLSCDIRRDTECNLESLTSLDYLMLSGYKYVRTVRRFISFPASLKKLILKYTNLPWSDMSIIQSLPNLEILKLLFNSIVGSRWDAGEEQFRQLKFLVVSELEIKEWEASSINFPCLKQLVVDRCKELEEIPLDFGYIPTLELISISHCKDSLGKSLDTIEEEQHNQGNFELKINLMETWVDVDLV